LVLRSRDGKVGRLRLITTQACHAEKTSGRPLNENIISLAAAFQGSSVSILANNLLAQSNPKQIYKSTWSYTARTSLQICFYHFNDMFSKVLLVQYHVGTICLAGLISKICSLFFKMQTDELAQFPPPLLLEQHHFSSSLCKFLPILFIYIPL
jgi:hypothetical protein